MNSVVHFEIPANDAEKLTQFFADVFGWTFQKFGEEAYYLTSANAGESKSIGGAIMQRKDPRQPLVNSIDVESIDAMIPVIESHGGKLVVPKQTIPGVGYMAYFMDPDMNIHGLWQPDENAA